VKNVLKDGPAAQDGKIAPGNKIFWIPGGARILSQNYGWEIFLYIKKGREWIM
jgi:hypothetical protein